MLITEKEELKDYGTNKRLWQGIPSIEVTKSGRIFLTFYSGGIAVSGYFLWQYGMKTEL